MATLNPSTKRQNVQEEEEDRISGLPDVLLAAIICKLSSLAEIARTSVVSKRWGRMSKEAMAVLPRLEFCGFTWLKPAKQSGGYDEAMQKFVNHVNGVMDLAEKGSSAPLEELKIVFPVSSNHSDDIKRWVNFAAKKQVEKLRWDLCTAFLPCKGRPYDGKSLVESSPPLRSLRDVYIRGISVSETVVAGLFSNSPSLERLCVSFASDLVGLEIVAAQAPNLKCLEVCWCRNLRSLDISTPNLTRLDIFDTFRRLTSIKISAPKLTWFRFWGVFVNPLLFSDLPVSPLSHVSIGIKGPPISLDIDLFDLEDFEHDVEGAHVEGDHFEDGTPRPLFIRNFEKLLGQLSPVLNTLRLDIVPDILERIDMSMCRQFPELSNLEHLEMSLPMAHYGPMVMSRPILRLFHWPCAMLRAAPLLHTLSLELLHESITPEDILSKWRVDQISKEVQGRHSHQHLKVVEVAGFTGCWKEIELLLHLVEIAAASLQKIVIDVRLPVDNFWRQSTKDNPHVELCRERAQLLKSHVGPGIDVVLL